MSNAVRQIPATGCAIVASDGVIFRPAETLAVHIWKINSEGVVPDLAAISNGTAAVLMICVLLFNLIARFVGKRVGKKLVAE